MRHIATILFVALAGCATAAAQGIPACEDGIDNDGDGLIDYPADPGCLSPDGTTEVNSPLDAGLDSGMGVGDGGTEPPDGGTLFDLSMLPAQGGGAATAGTESQAGAQLPPASHTCGFATTGGGASAIVLILGVLAVAIWRRAHGAPRRGA